MKMLRRFWSWFSRPAYLPVDHTHEHLAVWEWNDGTVPIENHILFSPPGDDGRPVVPIDNLILTREGETYHLQVDTTTPSLVHIGRALIRWAGGNE